MVGQDQFRSVPQPEQFYDFMIFYVDLEETCVSVQTDVRPVFLA